MRFFISPTHQWRKLEYREFPQLFWAWVDIYVNFELWGNIINISSSSSGNGDGVCCISIINVFTFFLGGTLNLSHITSEILTSAMF
jgi:hypothetical protein